MLKLLGTIVLCVKLVLIYSQTCPAPDSIPVCFTVNDFNKAFNASMIKITDMENFLKVNLSRFTQKADEPGVPHFHTVVDLPPEFYVNHRLSQALVLSLQSLAQSFSLTNNQVDFCLNNVTGLSIPNCNVRTVNCTTESTNYYPFDGTCNNPINPLWGAAGEASIRLLPSSYTDGIFKPLSDIPSARLMAQQANSQKPGTQSDLSFINNDWTNGFSQLVAHDGMRHVKYQVAGGGTGFSCCSGTDPQKINYNSQNMNCQPIPIATNDTTYGPQGIACLNYVRTMLTHQECKVQQDAHPVNAKTPFLDLDPVYNKATFEHLKNNNGKFSVDNATVMKQIILKGDDRSDEWPILFLAINVFCRLHNIIFDELVNRNPNSTFDLLFETREIVTGIYQVCILEMIQGLMPSQFDDFNLGNTANCYDNTIKPQISVEYIAAFRFLHIFMNEEMTVFDKSIFVKTNPLKGQRPKKISAQMAFFNTTWVEDNPCGLLHGAIKTSWNVGKLGPNMNSLYFAPTQGAMGLDLRALDFQSEKDLGLAKYCRALEKFNNVHHDCDDQFNSSDFRRHNQNAINIFQKNFAKLCDITLGFASDLETRSDAIGPTTAFFICDQIQRSMCGDRFWFGNNAKSTAEQKRRLRRMTMRDVLCLVFPCGVQIQQLAFLSPDINDNQKSPCVTSDALAKLSLDSWF